MLQTEVRFGIYMLELNKMVSLANLFLRCMGICYFQGTIINDSKALLIKAYNSFSWCKPRKGRGKQWFIQAQSALVTVWLRGRGRKVGVWYGTLPAAWEAEASMPYSPTHRLLTASIAYCQ